MNRDGPHTDYTTQRRRPCRVHTTAGASALPWRKFRGFRPTPSWNAPRASGAERGS